MCASQEVKPLLLFINDRLSDSRHAGAASLVTPHNTLHSRSTETDDNEQNAKSNIRNDLLLPSPPSQPPTKRVARLTSCWKSRHRAVSGESGDGRKQWSTPLVGRTSIKIDNLRNNFSASRIDDIELGERKQFDVATGSGVGVPGAGEGVLAVEKAAVAPGMAPGMPCVTRKQCAECCRQFIAFFFSTVGSCCCLIASYNSLFLCAPDATMTSTYTESQFVT